MKSIRHCFPCLILLLMSGPVLAQGLVVAHWPGSPPPQPIPAPTRSTSVGLECRQHQVDATIEDQIATTKVEQVFYNPHPGRLEGHYLFPLPQGAQIERFEMEIDGKMTSAELLDADKARKIYEDIVRSMRDPDLMEYAGRGMLRVRIFPIEPHSTRRVRLTYTELLRSDSGLIGYRQPFKTLSFNDRPVTNASVRIELKTADPLRTIYSPSHKVDVNRKADREAVIGFEQNDVTADRDFELYYSIKADNEIDLNLMTYHDGDDEGGTFLLLATPSLNIADDQVIRKDVIFVIDTSGSMAGEKLEQAKRALRFCVANLNKQDRFAIIRFSTEAESLFDGVVDASVDNRRQATTFIEGFKARGGTAIEGALLSAMKPMSSRDESDRPCVVIFMTDGRPTVGNTDEDQIVASVTKTGDQQPPRIFCFGIGADINMHLLDKITEKTRAASQYVLPEEDIEVKVSNFYTRISSPVLAETTLKLNGPVRIRQMYPAPLPDLFKGDQLVVLGRYSGHGRVSLTLDGKVNGVAKTIDYGAHFAKAGAGSEHAFIPRLWAVRRVGYLLDKIRLHGENQELRDETARLARRYGIVTPYTAYLILEDERGGPVPVVTRSLAPRSGAAGDHQVRFNRALREQYHSMRRARSGRAAVRGSVAAKKLKEASTMARPGMDAGGRIRLRSSLGVGLDEKADTGADFNSPHDDTARYVAGKTFYRHGGLWVDAAIADHPDVNRVKIRFATDDYFDLMKGHRRVRAWLAVGRHVHVLIGTTICEIADES